MIDDANPCGCTDDAQCGWHRTRALAAAFLAERQLADLTAMWALPTREGPMTAQETTVIEHARLVSDLWITRGPAVATTSEWASTIGALSDALRAMDANPAGRTAADSVAPSIKKRRWWQPKDAS